MVAKLVKSLGYRLDDRFFSQKEAVMEYFRPAMGPTQPPTKWILGALMPGVKQPMYECDYFGK
jgi:hypothetical protein